MSAQGFREGGNKVTMTGKKGNIDGCLSWGFEVGGGGVSRDYNKGNGRQHIDLGFSVGIGTKGQLG